MRIRMLIASLILAVIAAPLGAGGATQSLGGVTLTEVKPRVVTPNGDLLNDVIYFKFAEDDSLSGLPIEGKIFDLTGAEISKLTSNNTETALLWDGKDENGKDLPSGIYVYAIKLGAKQATGTVVVAR